jgi:[protein-PII] uridylyltransferase
LTGALTSHRLSILSAQIHTLSDGFLLDRFCVEDEDHVGPPPDSRIDEVSQALTNSLDPTTATAPVFRRIWKETADRMNADLEILPTRVSIDNSTSPDCTIVDVFTHDREGLLYEITRALYELNASVRYAKIGTYLDQVVDVFYLTDLNGNKILAEQRLEEIQQGLAQAIEASRTT